MTLIYASSVGDTITQSVADVAEALRYPVLITAMLALLLVVYEIGRLAVEAWKRSQLPKAPFEQVSRQAFGQMYAGDSAGAQATLTSYAYNQKLKRAAVGTMFAQNAIDAQRAVIDYDLYISKRLDRVRLLVRAGPALGLMGTLIPLSPALAALGKGQPEVLADELQTAFSITVVGVLVGLVAFTVALVRERYYTKDLADLEFLRELRGDAATISPAATIPQPSAAAPSHQTATDEPEAASQTVADQATAAATAAPATPASTPPAATPAPAPAPAAVGPVVPTPPGTPPPAAPVPPAAGPTPSTPPAFPPAVPEKPKKKFGLKKKASKAPAPTAFPPPPPSTTMPPGAAPAIDPSQPVPPEPKPPADDAKNS